MPAAPEITDRKSLKAWLDALPRATEAEEAEAHRIATAIAFRAAMRVLPRAVPFFLFEPARKRDLTPLRIFRLVVIAGVAGTCPTPAIKAAANAAARPAHAAADAAAYAAHAAAAADAAAADAAAYAAHAAAAADAAAWSAVAKDCHATAEGTALHLQPLWPDGTNPLAQDWQSTATALRLAGPEWTFWIDWYEKCLHGAPQDWPGLLTDIALIAPDDWDKGPQHIAGMIEELQRKPRSFRAPPEARTVEAVRKAVAVNRQPLRLQLDALLVTIAKEMEKNTLEEEVREKLAELQRIAADLHDLLPEEGGVAQETAAEMAGLLDLYKERLQAWPRLHADDVVDGTFRITLIGLSAGAFGLFGVPAWAGVALGGAVFGGKRLVDAAKSLRGSISGGGT